VRQPEVVRLLALLVALALAAPALLTARRLLVAGGAMLELLGEGRRPLLSALAPEPRRETLRLPGVAADRYRAPRLGAAAPLLLVHGFTPEGKDDPRVRRAAGLLARAGFEVTVPTIPGLTQGRLRPADVEPVVSSVAALAAASRRAVTVVSVSVGAGPALVAAADPRIRDHVGTILCVGGYASAVELLRFFLTGDYAWGEAAGHVDHDPRLVTAFVEANADLVDPATGRALAAGDRARIAAVLAAPPPALRRVLDALSPERVAGEIRAPLILVHGRGDRAVPFTESLRLAAARPERTSVVLVGVLGHVEQPAALGAAHLGDLLALWVLMYRLCLPTWG
jgi:pimeloyl-ACP methyl ester carboxylesterase